MSRIKTPNEGGEKKAEKGDAWEERGRGRGGVASSHYNPQSRLLLGAITAAGGYYLPQVSDGCGGMQDGQHGPAVIQEPDVVLLVEDLQWWEIDFFFFPASVTTTKAQRTQIKHVMDSTPASHLSPAVPRVRRYEHAGVGGGQFCSCVTCREEHSQSSQEG